MGVVYPIHIHLHAYHHNDPVGERDIQSLQLKCNFNGAGCTWVGELRHLDDHLSKCGFMLLCCPNQCTDKDGESVFIMRQELENHVTQQCLYRQYQCPHCCVMGQFWDMTTTHLEACPAVEILCLNGCGATIARGEFDVHSSSTCPNAQVQCKYVKIGCKETPLRKHLQEHECDDKFHFPLAVETILSMTKRIDEEVEKQLESRLEKELEKKLMKNADWNHVFKLSEFQKHKEDGTDWFSPPFFSYRGGYRMGIRVVAEGYDRAKHTHISVYTYLTHGRNDNNLIWPFRGEVTVTLLNQLDDKNHCTLIIPYDTTDSVKYNSRVVDKERSTGRGFTEFLPHTDLGHLVEQNRQYLKDDALFLRVSVEVYASNKPWLTCIRF